MSDSISFRNTSLENSKIIYLIIETRNGLWGGHFEAPFLSRLSHSISSQSFASYSVSAISPPKSELFLQISNLTLLVILQWLPIIGIKTFKLLRKAYKIVLSLPIFLTLYSNILYTSNCQTQQKEKEDNHLIIFGICISYTIFILK